MKKTLGKYLIFLLFFNFLYAKDWFFKVNVDRDKVYQREAILLEIDFYKDENLRDTKLEFEPKDKKFTFKKLEKRVEFKDNYEIEKFKYLIFGLQKGRHTLKLKATIKERNPSVTGLLEKESSVNLEPIKLNIIQIQKDIEYVGIFDLNVSIDKPVVLKNEPVHLNLTLQKSATINDIPLKYEIENVDIYEGNLNTLKLSDKTTQLEQKLAFVSDTNFTIPSLTFKYFNTLTKKIEIAKSPEFNITVYEDKKVFEKLLDEEEKPKDIEYYQNEAIKYFPYFIIFIVGFILGKLLNIKLPKFKRKNITLFDKIKATKEKKELIKLLLPYASDRRVIDCFNQLEDEKLKFKRVKKAIVKDKSLREIFSKEEGQKVL